MTDVVLFSGGLDSTVTAFMLRSAGIEPLLLHLDYGQPAAAREKIASTSLAVELGCELQTITTSIPYCVMPNGEIPGRNLFLIAAALAVSSGLRLLALGIHRGTDYYDCNDDFFRHCEQIVNGYSSGTTQLVAPVAHLTKREIVAYAVESKIPIDLTYSCERANEPCEACASCKERRDVMSC
jgi:7-cyano-7-deazaguanine synthase